MTSCHQGMWEGGPATCWPVILWQTWTGSNLGQIDLLHKRHLSFMTFRLYCARLKFAKAVDHRYPLELNKQKIIIWKLVSNWSCSFLKFHRWLSRFTIPDSSELWSSSCWGRIFSKTLRHCRSTRFTSQRRRQWRVNTSWWLQHGQL